MMIYLVSLRGENRITHIHYFYNGENKMVYSTSGHHNNTYSATVDYKYSVEMNNSFNIDTSIYKPFMVTIPSFDECDIWNYVKMYEYFDIITNKIEEIIFSNI